MREPLRLTLVEGPATLPVSLNEVKKHLNIEDDQTSEEALITGYLSTAVRACEQFTKRALITQTWQLFRDAWPTAMRQDNYWEGWREGPESILFTSARSLEMPKAPLQSVVHIKTYDDSDAASTYGVTNYFVDTASEPGRIVLRASAAAPNPTRVANGLEVQFKAGYGDNPGDVPEELRHGILMATAFLYEQRGECPLDGIAAQSQAAALWNTYRIMRIM